MKSSRFCVAAISMVLLGGAGPDAAAAQADPKPAPTVMCWGTSENGHNTRWYADSMGEASAIGGALPWDAKGYTCEFLFNG